MEFFYSGLHCSVVAWINQNYKECIEILSWIRIRFCRIHLVVSWICRSYMYSNCMTAYIMRKIHTIQVAIANHTNSVVYHCCTFWFHWKHIRSLMIKMENIFTKLLVIHRPELFWDCLQYNDLIFMTWKM